MRKLFSDPAGLDGQGGRRVFDVCIVKRARREQTARRGERGISSAWRQPQSLHHDRILEESGSHRPKKFARRISCSPATSASRMTTAISGTSEPRGTDHHPPSAGYRIRAVGDRTHPCSSTRRVALFGGGRQFPIRSAPKAIKAWIVLRAGLLRRANSWAREIQGFSSRCSSPAHELSAPRPVSPRACR